MVWKRIYKGKADSPVTYTTTALNTTDTSVTLADINPVSTGETAGYLVFKVGENTEVVEYLTAPVAGVYTIIRGVDGRTPLEWPIGSVVYREYTSLDQQDIIDVAVELQSAHDAIPDITITNLTTGQVPKYNGTFWVNATLTPTEVGAASSSHVHTGVYLPIADASVTNARTPTTHATTHKSAGADAIKLDELAAPTDVTTLNATTALHGLCPKGDNNTGHYLNGALVWASLGPSNIPSGLDMGLITTGVTTTGANIILNSGPDSATGWGAGGADNGYTTAQKLMGLGSFYLTCNKVAGWTDNYITAPFFTELPYFEPGKPYAISVYVRSTVAGAPFRTYITGAYGMNFSANGVVGKAITQPTTPSLTLTTGGSLSAELRSVVITAVNENGETLASDYASVTNTATNNAISVSWTAVDGATGYNVYIGVGADTSIRSYGRRVNSTPIVGTTYTVTTDPNLGCPPVVSTAEWKRLTGYGIAETISAPAGYMEGLYTYPTGAFNGTFWVANAKFETGKLCTAWIANPKDKFLGIGAKAADSDLLDSHDTSYFATATHTHSTDLTAALGTDHTVSGVTVSLTAAASVTIGQVCYINSSGQAALTDADAIATMPVRVMATASITSGATGVFLLSGYMRDDSLTFTPGATIYASGTAGAITHTAPTGTAGVVQSIGYAITTHIMYFNPGAYVELV